MSDEDEIAWLLEKPRIKKMGRYNESIFRCNGGILYKPMYSENQVYSVIYYLNICFDLFHHAEVADYCLGYKTRRCMYICRKTTDICLHCKWKGWMEESMHFLCITRSGQR